MATAASREEIDRQVKALDELHRRLLTACWAKCVYRVKDATGEMNIGEMACVDRCVAKYIETQALVRTELEAARAKMPIDYP